MNKQTIAVLDYLRIEGFSTDVDYWVGFQEEEHKREELPLGFDANIFVNDGLSYENGFTITIYPLEVGANGEVAVFTSGGDSSSETFTWEEYLAAQASLEAESTNDKLSLFSNEELIDKLLERFKNKTPPSPYHRKITKRALLNGLFMDSYDIDAMWPLPGNLSPLQHARKKSLAPGSRGEGHKSIKKDLAEIAWSAKEAIQTYIDME